MPDKAESKREVAEVKPAAKPAEKPATVLVVYRGPHGRFIAGEHDMTVHGEPVEMPQDVLAQLRETFPEHRFEDATPA